MIYLILALTAVSFLAGMLVAANNTPLAWKLQKYSKAALIWFLALFKKKQI